MEFAERTKIIYVLGVSRSGSTVLASALGAHPAACYVGEIAFTPIRGWEGERVCSCGARWNECPFWRQVRHGVERRLGRLDVEEYRRLQRLFEPYPLDGKGWVRLAWAKYSDSPALAAYGRMMATIFESVREASGKQIIVDSSKHPGRAVALATVPELDVNLVHVVRDARGVAFSMAKRFEHDASKGIYHTDRGEPVTRSAALWSLVNALCEIAGRTVPRGRFVQVRYEDFSADAAGCLSEVGNLVGLDYGAVARSLVGGEALPLGHVLNGNRLRFSGSVRLKPDREWEHSLGWWDRARVQLCSGPLLRWYGY